MHEIIFYADGGFLTWQLTEYLTPRMPPEDSHGEASSVVHGTLEEPLVNVERDLQRGQANLVSVKDWLELDRGHLTHHEDIQITAGLFSRGHDIHTNIDTESVNSDSEDNTVIADNAEEFVNIKDFSDVDSMFQALDTHFNPASLHASSQGKLLQTT